MTRITEDNWLEEVIYYLEALKQVYSPVDKDGEEEIKVDLDDLERLINYLQKTN